MPWIPAFPGELKPLLQAAQDHGTSSLLHLDEAEVVAVGGPPLPRTGQSQWIGSAADASRAVARLRARGLLDDEDVPMGALAGYLSLLVHPKAKIGAVSSWLDPETAPAAREQFRIGLLTDVVGGGIAMVEQVQCPVPESVDPLPVRVEILRLDVLVQRVVDMAFTPGAGDVRETATLFADSRRQQSPTSIRVDSATGVGVLTAPRRGFFGTKVTATAAGRDDLADHLRARLLSAG